MSAASDYLENEILDQILGASAWTAPDTVYIALHTADPGDDGAANEVSGNAYARVAVANNLTQWPAASGGSKSNANAIQFADPSGGNWGSITHMSIWDASTSGNCLLQAALTTARSVNDGDPGPRFPAGTLAPSVA